MFRTLAPIRSGLLIRFEHVPSSHQICRAFHNTTYVRASRYKWALRPDLRDSKIVPKEEDPDLNKETMTQHAMWFKEIDPDVLAARWQKMMETSSHELRQGGFSLGKLFMFIQIANKPSHLNLVFQAVSVLVHKQPNQVPSTNFVAAFCKASAALGIPDVGLAFLQSPWLKFFPTEVHYEHLLKGYVKQANEHFLEQVVQGRPPVIPGMRETQNTEEADEEEEEEENPEKKEKIAQRKLATWLAEFTAVYKDLVSTRHEWKPTARTLGHVAAFYAAVGDADAALKIFQSLQDKSKIPAGVRSIIMLALVANQRLEEAQAIEDEGAGKKERVPIVGIAALALAKKDEEKLFDFYSRVKKFNDPRYFQLHFGDPERIAILKRVVDRLSTATELSEEVVEYVQGLEGASEAAGEAEGEL